MARVPGHGALVVVADAPRNEGRDSPLVNARRSHVSIVVPVLNGAATIEELAVRVAPAMAGFASYQLVFVDDGSSDDTWRVITGLADGSPAIEGVRLAENRGQAAAIAAGLSASTGDVVATIDADLETYPEDIPLLVASVDAGADLASGWRTGHRGLLRSAPSFVFNARVRTNGIPVHDLGCGMNAMTARLAADYVAYGTIRRGLPKSLLALLATEIAEVRVRSVRRGPSRLGFGDLANFWVEYESMHGRLPHRWRRPSGPSDVPAFEVADRTEGVGHRPRSGTS